MMSSLLEDQKNTSIAPVDDEEVVVITEKSEFLPSSDIPSTTATTETKTKNKETTSWTKSRYAGIILAVLSGLLFTSTGIIVKYLKGYHVLNVGLFRFVGMFVPAIPLVLRACLDKRNNIFEPIWPPTDRKRLGMMMLLFVSIYVLQLMESSCINWNKRQLLIYSGQVNLRICINNGLFSFRAIHPSCRC